MLPASIVQLTSVPPGRVSVTERPVAAPALLLLSVTVNPICEPALTLTASAVLVIVTPGAVIGVGVGVGVGAAVGAGVGVGGGVGVGVGGAVCTEIGIVLVTVLPASSETVRPTLYRPGTGKTFDGFCASEKSPSSKVHAYCVTVRPGELAVAENVTATPGGPVLGSAFTEQLICWTGGLRNHGVAVGCVLKNASNS